ncbi:hypothetical protein Csa_005463 [Cucumis sativus]|uniref:Uncharacterized protein n=1 Tax=Cucumis sativus TaxID=3659 RepID=A0A0A0K9J1_CUCSA|nr:hypothetical protein Csa_005463 [Cucumis sativus]
MTAYGCCSKEWQGKCNFALNYTNSSSSNLCFLSNNPWSGRANSSASSSSILSELQIVEICTDMLEITWDDEEMCLKDQYTQEGKTTSESEMLQLL